MSTQVEAWNTAIARAIESLSPGGARERRRHAAGFAAWCATRELEPGMAGRSELDAYLASLGTGDRQLPAKARCALRAVMREIDPEHAARVAGLGNQTKLLPDLYEGGLGALVEEVCATAPSRRAVRRACLTRLFAWCSAVGVDPLALDLGDLTQFRAWLVEVRAHVGETMVVAKDFILLRHSAEGRRMLGENAPRPTPLRLELEAPLRPRFELGDLASPDPLTPLPAALTFEVVARRLG